MLNKKHSLHYLGLVSAIVIGAILRFWNLDLKPLWLDEVITTIFSLGKNYHDVPLNVVFPIERLQEIFTWKSGVSCSQIAENVITQSNHPPLFFCLMHGWLSLVRPLGKDWVFKLRELPALFGIAGIISIYFVNRIAFSRSAGLTAAALMAVSPFAVYLSQEARHYTLPVLLIILGLIFTLQIQRDIFQGRVIRFWVWLAWAITNAIGLYVHYFFAIAFIAQVVSLILVWYFNREKIFNHRQVWLALLVFTMSVIISYLPWIPIMLHHLKISETNWLGSPHNIGPIYETLVAWVLMVIILPVENQPLAITVISGLLMIIFFAWMVWQGFIGFKRLWNIQSMNIATLTLLICTLCVLLQFLFIAYILKKDITLIPRYHFVYYPSLVALFAASLTVIPKSYNLKSRVFIFAIGIISSIFVVNNLAFQKSLEPGRIAQIMNQQPSVPLMVVVGYGHHEDVALGLGFILALEKLREATYSPSTQIAFFKQLPDFSSVWLKLSQLPPPESSAINLWIVGPGRRKDDYPQQVALSKNATCTKDSKNYYRIGVPYQLYKCNALNS